MTQVTPESLLGIFLIFCRIGGCVMIVPGFSSNRIPVKIRVLVALTVTLAVSPLALGKIQGGLAHQPPFMTLQWIFTETLTGFLIGLLGRVYFFALQALMTGVAMAIGFGSIPGAPVDDAEPLPAIGTFIMMVGVAVLFVSDLHWELVRGLLASYARLPVGQGFGAQASLVQLTDQISAAFVLALRISSPFIIYSVVVNLAVGLTNKLTPQIPVFFLATPFVMLGGLFVMYFLVQDYILMFMEAFSTWLKHG